MDSQPNFRRNLFLSVLLALFAGFLLSSVYLWLATERQAKTETLQLGDAFALQSEILIRPLLLSNDRVSLNYLLNELVQVTHISGLQVEDRNGILIARAGDTSELKQVRRFMLQEKSIGAFTIWLNPQPTKALLSSQHIPIAILAAMNALFVLLSLWFFSRDADGTEPTQTEADDEPLDFPSTLAAETQKQSSVLEPEASPAPVLTEPLAAEQTPFEAKLSPPPANTTTPVADRYETNDLIDLLKPERSSTPQMPKFEHHPQDLEPETDVDEDDNLIFEEQELQNVPLSTPTLKENPLFKMQARKEKEEQQLELYSFEHELELILPAQDAIYLFYIDTHTACSDNISSDEKAALVNVYYHLAKQVARIYSGEAEQLQNGDILLRFELRDDKDSHGINALCAAMLFSLLYKGFNQSRIKGFQPVISLQMSIARGHHGRHSLVQEEAHFLTRTTHSNELISHTALTEAPLVKQTLLANADIRREDEDKVLLMKLTAKHQTLLQKQANHLLTKIFNRSKA